MVDTRERLGQIRILIEEGAYFSINCARQYGKTTILAALAKFLEEDYLVISLDFQKFSQSCFKKENSFCRTFAAEFIDEATRAKNKEFLPDTLQKISDSMVEKQDINLRELFKNLQEFCEKSVKSIILLIDEVDSAANNQVFIDFLAQLRSGYLEREVKDQAVFHSVVLASVYDIRNIKQKIRGGEKHKMNSSWNIAADFDVDMSFSEGEIAEMLVEYSREHHTIMNESEMAGLLYDYTSGYPFLVSRLCKIIDEKIPDHPWTTEAFQKALRLLLKEKNPLFDSLTGKLAEYPELDQMLNTMLFTGKNVAYNPDVPAIDMASMLGFVRNQGEHAVIANRIFETRLYNRYLSISEMQNQDIHRASLMDKNQFVAEGHLDMRRILERFTEHFNDLYCDSDEKFLEEEGRKYFLLYLRPIINGVGNYYIESRTRELRRTDVIVDYRGEQYIIEMKLWRGEEYHNRGQEQLAGYLNDYGKNKGYMISFNFNKKKQIGVFERRVGDKIIIEAVV